MHNYSIIYNHLLEHEYIKHQLYYKGNNKIHILNCTYTY